MPTPDFILELRKHVGHAPLWVPGVTAIVLKEVPADAPLWEVPHVLLVQRADNGEWTPVTGIVDPGEEPHEAAIREVAEETGLSVTHEALLGVGRVGPVHYPNGDITNYVDTAIRCSLVDGSPTEPHVADDESVAVGWFSISQLPPMKPRFRLIIADAVAQMKHPQGFRPRMGYTKRNSAPQS